MPLNKNAKKSRPLQEQPQQQTAERRPDGLFARRCDHIATQGHRLFIFTAAIGVFVFIVWANLAQLNKVARGSGKVIPATSNQIVQHLEGGIVSKIFVRQGQRVQQGDILVRIRNSFSRAEKGAARLEIIARNLEMKRLTTELGDAETLTFPKETTKNYPKLVANEISLFNRRRASLDEQLAILKDQSDEKKLELEELKARLHNKARERELARQQVQSLARLVKMGAASRNALLEKKAALQRLKGVISDLNHQIPRTNSNYSQALRKGREAKLRFRAETEKQRSVVQLKLSKLEQTMNAMTDRNQRFDVRAPIAGVVNRLTVSTIGGVVKPGQDIAEIVPADKAVSIEARISPRDRAHVWPGLPALIRISAYDYSINGGLSGKVTQISPDALTDERGAPYFRVRLEAAASNFGPDKPVVPGMIADVDILTGKHSVMSYLLKPINRLASRALEQ